MNPRGKRRRNDGTRRPAGDPAIRELRTIPGVGPSIAADLRALGIRRIADLRGRTPEGLYERSNRIAGTVQDRCLLYVFRCAVYFAESEGRRRDPDKLKWWNWMDGAKGSRRPSGRGKSIQRKGRQ